MITRHPTIAHTSACLTHHDVKIAGLAACEFQRSSYRALRDVGCTYHDGVLTLRGCLSSFYLKQVAQTLVRDLPSVERIDNQIEVVSPPHSGSARNSTDGDQAAS